MPKPSSNLKVAFLSYSDREGGAAIAALRLYKCLQDAGVDIGMLVDKKVTQTPGICPIPRPASLIKRFHRYATRRILDFHYPSRNRVHFSTTPFPDVLFPSSVTKGASVAHAHWTGNSFVGLSSLERLKLPIVWTLHDMMPFTGGCHYDSHCGRYTTTCGCCPVLGSASAKDVSCRELRSKAEAVRNLTIKVACPSRWLAACARSSSVFRDADIRVIPYGLDLSLFRPEPQAQARAKLSLPMDVPLILIGAFGGIRDPRKGYAEICHILNHSAASWPGKMPQVVVFGHGEQPTSLLGNFRCHVLGGIHEDVTLASLYSAADVFLAPSKQDNLPNTILEALACGTPVVSCRVGGIPDMVEHMRNGYLAPGDCPQEMQAGLQWILANPLRHSALRLAASGVSLNVHIAAAGNQAANIRLFEATGVGTCLVTDWKDNIPEIFEPDREVVVFRTPSEAIEKISYLLTHDEERRKIAERGQRRTLSTHHYADRLRELCPILLDLVQ